MSPNRLPWQVEGDRLPTFFVGVSAPARVDREVAIDVLRDAFGLATSWIGVDITWSTFMSVVEDDVRTPVGKMSRPGLDWDFVSARTGTAKRIVLTGVCTALADHPSHPNHTVAEVSVSFPVFVAGLGREVGRMSVAVSVQRWAMYGSGENMPWIAGPVGPWVMRSAEILGADTGYAILDQVMASDSQSPLERRSAPPVGGFGSGPDVWGYGWGTLLSPAHLDRIGDVGALEGAHIEQLPGGGEWVTLGDDPSQVPEAAMWRLHEVLQPAFPAPRPLSVEAPVEERAVPRTVDDVRAAWRAAADAARAEGRVRGMFGPIGFTLEADVPEAVVPRATAFTDGLIMFEGLDAEAAAVLLRRMDAEALDMRARSGSHAARGAARGGGASRSRAAERPRGRSGQGGRAGDGGRHPHPRRPRARAPRSWRPGAGVAAGAGPGHRRCAGRTRRTARAERAGRSLDRLVGLNPPQAA